MIVEDLTNTLLEEIRNILLTKIKELIPKLLDEIIPTTNIMMMEKINNSNSSQTSVSKNDNSSINVFREFESFRDNNQSFFD